MRTSTVNSRPTPAGSFTSTEYKRYGTKPGKKRQRHRYPLSPCLHLSLQGRKGQVSQRVIWRHTGLIQADFDDVVGEAAQRLIKRLRVDPHTRLIFRSPRGKAKAFFKVSAPSTAHEHKAAFSTVVNHCHLNGYGEIDTIVAPVNSLCFISHDPEAALKDATPLGWTPLPEHPSVPAKQIEFDGEPDLVALDFIPNDCDYETWRTVGMAIKTAGLGVEVFEKWTGGGRQRSTGEWTKEDIQAHWNRYKGEGITWGSVVHLARENGWAPPPRGKRPNLILSPEPMKPPTEGWRSQQVEIEKAFGSEHDTILIKADAGVGKDYAKTSYILQSDIEVERSVEMVTRVGLGDEKVLDFKRRQESHKDHRAVYQWRSVFYNHEESREFHIRKTLIGDGLMCVQPGKFDALRQKGITPQASLCPSCPVQFECMGEGYLSQVKTASQADYFITAQDGFLFDKSVSGFAQKIVKSARDTVGMWTRFGRMNSLTLLNCQSQNSGTWAKRGTAPGAGVFAVEVLQALELGTQPDLVKLREIVLSLSGGQRKMIVEAFTKHRIHGRALFDSRDKIYEDG